MQRIWLFLLDPRVLAVIGLLALAGLLFLGADALRVGAVWAAGALLLLGLLAAGIWWHRRRQARRAGLALEQAISADAEKAVRQARKGAQADEVAALRERMADAVKRIKTSRLGETS